MRCCRTSLHRPGDPSAGLNVTGTNPDWVKAKARTGGAVAIYTCAVSSDDRYLAVGGGDHKIHLWDLRSQTYVAVRCSPRAPQSLGLPETLQKVRGRFWHAPGAL